MREFRTSGSVGASGSNPRGDPTTVLPHVGFTINALTKFDVSIRALVRKDDERAERLRVAGVANDGWARVPNGPPGASFSLTIAPYLPTKCSETI